MASGAPSRGTWQSRPGTLCRPRRMDWRPDRARGQSDGAERVRVGGEAKDLCAHSLSGSYRLRCALPRSLRETAKALDRPPTRPRLLAHRTLSPSQGAGRNTLAARHGMGDGERSLGQRACTRAAGRCQRASTRLAARRGPQNGEGGARRFCAAVIVVLVDLDRAVLLDSAFNGSCYVQLIVPAGGRPLSSNIGGYGRVCISPDAGRHPIYGETMANSNSVRIGDDLGSNTIWAPTVGSLSRVISWPSSCESIPAR